MAGAPPAAAPRRPLRPAKAGEQVAEPLRAADPGRRHERGQPEQLRTVGQPGRAQPGGVQPRQAGAAVQRSEQRAGDVPAARVSPAADQRVPGERRGGQQRGVVAGKHRHCPRAGAAHGHEHAAGAAADVGAARIAQIRADQPGAGAQANQPGSAHLPPRGGLDVRQREIPGDLRRAVGRLGPLPGQRQVCRIQLRHHPAADEPQVRAQRPPRRARQARRAPGEPLGHRRVQQHLRHRLQAQPDRPVSQLPGRPQQVLRPLPPGRRRQRHDLPGERRRLSRHRRRPPAGDGAGDRANVPGSRRS